MSHATAEYLSGLDEDHQNHLECVTFYETQDWQNYTCSKDVTEAFVHSAEYLLNGGLKARFFQNDESLWITVLEAFLMHRPQREKLRAFFEDHFIPVRRAERHHPLLLTGYFEPEYEASTHPTETFSVPLYGRPSDLILIEDLGVINPKLAGHRVGGFVEGGTLKPYATRKEIYEGALSSKNLEIAYVKDLREAYFLSIQGSGVLVYPDQSKKRVAYAGVNGRPYQSIGALLVERGLIAPHEISMQSIWAWCEDHPHEMVSLFSENPSFVFFKFLEGTASSPQGAISKPLVPLCSLAVDPRFYPLGMPLWAAGASNPQRSEDQHQSVMFAHDTGGAIKGPYRGDVFCGTGQRAGERAGGMQLEGELTLFLPKQSQKFRPNTVS